MFDWQEHTLVGRSDASPQQDIQLSGIGIKPQHAIVDIDDSEVYITPLEDAKYAQLLRIIDLGYTYSTEYYFKLQHWSLAVFQDMYQWTCSDLAYQGQTRRSNTLG